MAKKVRSAPHARGFKSMQCKYCKNIVDRVGETVDAITCWKCTQDLVNGEKLEIRK